MATQEVPARGGERGFTILETVVAMIVMMTVGLGASALFLYSISNNSAATARSQSLAVAQQEMERLRSVDFSDPLLTVTAAAPASYYARDRGNYVFAVSKTVNTVAAFDVPAPGGGTKPTMKIVTLTVTPVVDNAKWAAAGVTVTTTRSTSERGPY